MNNFNYGQTCLFDKIIPKNDKTCINGANEKYYNSCKSQCDDHKSYATFTQGIFNVSGLNTEKFWKIKDFIDKHSGSNVTDEKYRIVKIECYLLKHPLFNFPIVFYPLFQFVHHAQLGFRFLNKFGEPIRHMNMQLQNSAYPRTSDTVPFDLPTTCKLLSYNVDENVDSSDIYINLNDKTGIYADFLERDDFTAEQIIVMNKYTYFKGINLDFLKASVNYNYFLKSYDLWRTLNTFNYNFVTNKFDNYDANNEKTQPQFTTIPPIIKKLNTFTCGKTSAPGEQPSPLAFNTGKCGGQGDGSLFVFNGFSPAFVSVNEGCILNFANLTGISDSPNDEISASKNLGEQFTDFMSWVYSNNYCSEYSETYTNSFSKHYITLSTAGFNYNWCKSQKLKDKDGKVTSIPLIPEDKLNNLFKMIRTTYDNQGNPISAPWLSDTDNSWTSEECVNFDKLLDALSNGDSIVQPYYDDSKYNDQKDNATLRKQYIADTANTDSCPFLCHGENYTCEIFSRFAVTMIMNDSTWSNNKKANVEKLFDFSAGGKKESEMSFTDNLFRAYTMYWPVAVYDPGYENGVRESIFNTDPKYSKDKEIYSKQSQLFKYLFKGDIIEASKTTNNPFIMILSEYLSLPIVKGFIDAILSPSYQNGFSTMTTVITGLLYSLFLHSFLGVEEVFVVGYPIRKVEANYTYSYVQDYDCEPSIYKFQIGKSSKAGIANNKCIEAYLEWIIKNPSPNPIFSPINSNDPIMNKLKDNVKAALDRIKNGITNNAPGDQSIDTINKECAKYNIPVVGDFSGLCKDLKLLLNTTRDIKEVAGGSKDLFDSFYNAIKSNPTVIPKYLLIEFVNFLGNTGNKIYEILTIFMGRFTTICHQNYTFDPQIIVQRNYNTDTPNFGFADFQRPTDPDSPCGNLQCNISGKTIVDAREQNTDITNNTSKGKKYDNTEKLQQLNLKGDFKITTPYHHQSKINWVNVTIIICIILLVCVILFIVFNLIKKGKKI